MTIQLEASGKDHQGPVRKVGLVAVRWRWGLSEEHSSDLLCLSLYRTSCKVHVGTGDCWTNTARNLVICERGSRYLE